MILLSGLVVLIFAAIHLLIGHLHVLNHVPRNLWLSTAGGVAVAYVFLHILPDLAAHQDTFAKGLAVKAGTADTLVFLVALAGLTAFYGLERLAKTSRGRARAGQGEDAVETHVFWIHLGSFAAYNVLIGYLLVQREAEDIQSLLLYGFAMATHFLTADFGLRDDHKWRYDHIGRWVLTAAVAAGWALALLVDLPEIVIATLFAFLAGGVVMNVLKEELPEDRNSRFPAFLLGAAGYSAVLSLL